MTTLTVLRHGDDIPLGWFEPPLETDVEEVMLHRGDPLPKGPPGPLVVLGGLMGAYDEEEHPWLGPEKRMLAAWVAAGAPVLGICLGCQLLADALGGTAFRSPDGPEIGVMAPRLSERGESDPVLQHLSGPVPVWHQDTWTLPPQGTLLASTPLHPHAFRLRGAVGIQAHPEAGPDVITRWAASPVGSAQLERAGVDAWAFLGQVAANGDRQRIIARRLFAAWLEKANSE